MFPLFSIPNPETIQRILKEDLGVEASLLLIVASIAVLTGLISLCRWLWRRFIKQRAADMRWRKEYVKKHLGNMFIEYKNARRRYIPTRIQSESSSNFEEPAESLIGTFPGNLCDRFIKRIFVESNHSRRLFCLLAGSGMGKTTALVNLFISYVEHYRESTMPYDISILSLAEENVLERVDRIGDKSNTILLLDALDENIEAVNDCDAFMERLERAVGEFRFVVISCRTQFFPSEDKQLKDSRLIRDGSQKGFAKYEHFYLSPFDDDEIAKFIDNVFGRRCWFSFFTPIKKRRRKKAENIIANPKCKNLLVRPMLLSRIEALADDPQREYTMTIEIYEALEEFWLDREVGRLPSEKREERKRQIKELSAELAQDIYDKRDERKGYFIERPEFEEFMRRKSLIEGDLQFGQRSLLNRDKAGLVKFAHKSFLEYYMARNYFKTAAAMNDFTGMSFAQELYDELCERHFEEYGRGSHPLNDRLPLNINHWPSYSNIPHIKDTQQGEFIDYTQKRFDTISIGQTSFNMRYLGFFRPQKLILEETFSPRCFAEQHDWMKDVSAIEMRTKHIQLITKFPNLKYLFVLGRMDMPLYKFLKQIQKTHPGISLVYNGEGLLCEGALPSIRINKLVEHVNKDDGKINQSRLQIIAHK